MVGSSGQGTRLVAIAGASPALAILVVSIARDIASGAVIEHFLICASACHHAILPRAVRLGKGVGPVKSSILRE